jgi:thymidine phosphorylase
MEVLADVELTESEIYDVVKKTNGCIVWGGSFHIAPADDVMIHVESPLLFESFDKIIVSIMAKKVAFGSNHVVIDLPYGKSVKVHHHADAEVLRSKFLYVAEKFNIKLSVLMHETDEPTGRGIGPVLECRDALRVLEQTDDRPVDLEKRALHLAGELLELCLEDATESVKKQVQEKYGSAHSWAKHLLESTEAHKKMLEIIEAQKGNPSVTTGELTKKLGKYTYAIKATHTDRVHEINSHNLTVIAKILGAPTQKGAGIYLDKKIGERFEKGDTLYTLFSEKAYTLDEAKESLKNFPIMKV